MSALFAVRPRAGSDSGFCLLADLVHAASAPRQRSGRRRIWWALVMLGMSWLGACSSAGVPFCEGDPPTANATNGYLLGPGDRVRVTVFGQPDLSGEFT